MSQVFTASTSGALNRQVVASAKMQSSSPISKRKRITDDNLETAPLKPAKRKKVKNSKRVEDENLDLDHGLNLALGKLDSRLQADYVAQRTKYYSSKLSLVELEDRHVPGMKSMISPKRNTYELVKTLTPAKPRHFGTLATGIGQEHSKICRIFLITIAQEAEVTRHYHHLRRKQVVPAL